MDTKKIGQSLLVIVGLIVGIIAAVLILLNPTGGIAGFSKLTAIIGLVLGLVNPRLAVFYLAGQAIYSDEIKRIGVYYGVESTQTVSEILVGPLITLMAINVSFLYGILNHKYRLGKLGWALYAFIPALAIVMLFAGESDSGLSLKLYNVGTTCLYMTLLPICYGLYQTMEEWVKVVSVQAILAAPGAAWGFWQYKYGFNTIEWTYALSGLSQVHSVQMSLPDPRVFGLFGSASAYGCVTLYGIFSIWRGLRYKQHRLLYLFLGALYMAAVVASEQRTILIYPVITLIFVFGFRHIYSTVALYSIALITFIVGIINADYLINTGLDKINALISSDSEWGRSVLNVDTYSDRLRGWARLNKEDTWSLLGTKWQQGGTYSGNEIYKSDFNHDIINKILINTGIVGLLISLISISFIIFQLHKVIFITNDRQLRNDGAFSMACIIPTLILSAIGGDNFTTNPINLQIWTIFAGIFVLKRISDTKSKEQLIR